MHSFKPISSHIYCISILQYEKLILLELKGSEIKYVNCKIYTSNNIKLIALVHKSEATENRFYCNFAQPQNFKHQFTTFSMYLWQKQRRIKKIHRKIMDMKGNLIELPLSSEVFLNNGT